MLSKPEPQHMFRATARPGAYGYEPTRTTQPQYKKATAFYQTMSEHETYKKLFGKSVRRWWPTHPGSGSTLTHLLRTIDNDFGVQMAIFGPS